MFPRSLRLGRNGFEQSRGLPRKTTPHFSISGGAFPDTAGIGIIVPKKVVKRAVERHRLKRRMREIVRKQTQDISGMIIVISARAGAADLSFDELTNELSLAFKAILAETHTLS